MPMEPSIAQQILEPKRPVCRFTGKSYASVAEEIEAIQKWRKRMLQVKRELDEKCKAVTKTSAPGQLYDLRMKRYTARWKLSLAHARFILLSKEAPAEGMTGPHSQHSHLNQKLQEPLRDLFTMEESSTDGVPYSLLHYILEDILYLLKFAMFRFGGRHFRGVMTGKAWSSPESISVVEFVGVLSYNPDFKDRVEFCQDEFRSISLLRNAHADESSDFTVKQTIALLTDVAVVTRALQLLQIGPQLQRYQKLLEDFERKIRPKHLQLLTRFSALLTHNRRNYQASQKLLDQEEKLDRLSRGIASRRSRRSRRAALNENNKTKATSVHKEWDRANNNATAGLIQDLESFTLQRRMRRMLNSLPPTRASQLLVALQADYA